MSTPAATPELLEGAIPLVAARRRREWVQTILDAWHLQRTKIGFFIFIAVLAVALIGPFVAPYSPTQFVGPPYSPPHPPTTWLGTDYIGHDVLTRVLWGGRTVFSLAIAATFIGLVLGVTLGIIAGYAKRATDETIMRLLDVLLAFPQIVLALLLISVIQVTPTQRLLLIVFTVGLSHMPRIARVTRAATLEVVGRDFVKAAEALGVPRRKILAYEVLPNITSPLLVEFGLRLTYSIGLIAALSFLGFGLQPPAADWGLMINENRIGIPVNPWAVAVPVFLIGALTIGTNLMADGLARALMGIDRDTGAK